MFFHKAGDGLLVSGHDDVGALIDVSSCSSNFINLFLDFFLIFYIDLVILALLLDDGELMLLVDGNSVKTLSHKFNK